MASSDVATANFDLICTLPLSADLITLATHPTQPLFVAGYASGFVQAYRLPEDSTASPEASTQEANGQTHDTSKNGSNRVTFSDKLNYKPHKPSKTKAKPRRSSLSGSIASPPPTGHSTIETAWRTRRHKGSCRALAFSSDGNTLFSAGTDGIIKAADAFTGRVVGKALVRSGKRPVQPSRLLALNPKTLMLGDDEGGVHEYELDQVPWKEVEGESRHAPVQSKPQKTHYPHRTEAHPDATDPITSLTALPPSGASTSKTSRAWTTTAGSTLAVCDIFKGVVTCSDEQGAGKEPLELLACTSVTMPKSAKQSQTNGKPQNRKKGGNAQAEEDQVVLLVGDSSGGCSLWPRGKWETRAGHTNIRRNYRIPGLPDEDYGVECIATAPASEEDPEPLIVAGLATGRLHFLKLDTQGRPRVLHSEYPHDDQGLDGCNAVAFDAHGRLISGGGSIVKIWRRKFEVSEVDQMADMDVDEEAEDTPASDDELVEAKPMNGMVNGEVEDLLDDMAEESRSDDGDDSDDEPSPPKKKKSPKVNSKKRKRGKPTDDGRGAHGILKVKGLL